MMAKAKTGKKKRTAKQKKGMKDLAAKMRGIDFCMMTTTAEDGALHARPMSNNGKVDFDGDAWFFSDRASRKVEELEANDAVNLSYVGGSKKAPLWITITGKAEILDDEDKKRALWVKGLDRWFEGGPDDPDVVLLHVEAHRAEWWSYEDEGAVDLT